MSWSYYKKTMLGEELTGPVTDSEFRAAISAGTVQPTTKVHHARFTKNNWVQASQLPALKRLFEERVNAQQLDKEAANLAKKENKLQKRSAKESKRAVKQAQSEANHNQAVLHNAYEKAMSPKSRVWSFGLLAGVIGFLVGLYGLVVFGGATTVMQQIVGALIILTASVMVVGGAILEGISEISIRLGSKFILDEHFKQ